MPFTGSLQAANVKAVKMMLHKYSTVEKRRTEKAPEKPTLVVFNVFEGGNSHFKTIKVLKDQQKKKKKIHG